MSFHLLDEQRCRQLQELRDLWRSEGDWASLALTCSLTEILNGDAGGAVRSPLQIELILRSLNRSSAKLLGRALL